MNEAIMDSQKARPGRPRKHEMKLVPVTGYVTLSERLLIEQLVGSGTLGEWIRDAIRRKLS